MATLASLAADISTHASALSQHLVEANLPPPSFAPDAPNAPSNTEGLEKIQTARMSLIEAAQAIRDLARGPVECILECSDFMKHDLAALKVITDFRIPEMIPLHGELSYAKIATKLGLSEYRIRRILRHAMTMRIFRESRPGYVAHTGPSAAFVRDPLLTEWVTFNLDEVLPADLKLAQALRQFGDSEEPADSAIGLAFGFDKDMTYWDFVANDGEGENKGWRMRRFADAMNFQASRNAHGHHFLHTAFDWKSLGNGTVVDVGGSSGHVSIALAKEFPQLQFTVQDFAPLESFYDAVPTELKSRITFEAHDILKPQKHEGADVYLLRSILHDWSDKYAVLILKNLVPALRDGARVIIADFIMPESGTGPSWIERISTSKSMQMMTVVNAKERTEQDWVDVVTRADSRYSVKAVVTPPGAAMSIIEIVFKTGS